MDYFSSSPYLEGADRALVAHSCVDRPPESYLLMAAAVTGNDEYLLFCNASDEDSLVERSVRNAEEPLRTWVTGRHAAVPHRLGRVGVAPLSRLFYGSVESYRSFTPSNGVYRQSVPYEQTFDKVYFRSGWTEDDDYLLLDGISGGSHSYQDGNCIVRFTSRGISWFQGPGGNAPATVRDYVGLSLAVDGCGPGCEERYAALRYFLEGDALAVAGTAMAYPQRGDWYRHIVWCRAGWFLVVDEVWSHIEGEFLVEGRWHLLGDVSPVEGGLRSVQADARLEMRHVGSGQQDLVASDHACTEDYTSWIQRTVARLTPGTGVRFATLFWADSTDHRREFRLLPENSGYRVEGGTDPVRIALSDKSEAPEISATGATLPTADGVCDGSDPAPFHIRGNGKTAVWRTACAGSVTTLAVQGTTGVAGDDRGGIVSFDRAGNVLWNQEIEGGVRAAAALEDGWVVGGDDETVHRLDASGDVVWSRRIEWQPMNWDSWTQKNCRVLSLAAGDIDGDGRVEILAGCADRHLYAFDDGGDLLWRSPCEWGPPVCLATARLGEGPELQTLAGLADPAIHGHTLVFGADGSLEKTLSRPDITCWGIPSWSRSLCVADVDGDGWDEVVSGVDTNHNQLIVYRRDGEVLWDADLGGAVLAVAVRDARVYAGASNGFVQCFGAEGGRLWSRFLVEPVMGLGPREAGGCRVALSGGSVIELGVEGTVTGSSEASAKTTAAAWVPQWGDGVLLVGGEDGVVRCFG
jgi:hypothetical protein